MRTVIIVSQIAISTLLIAAILMQNRGSGVSAIFGGGGGAYRTKRGFEKWLHVFTIVLAILFVSVGVINLIIAV